MPSRGTARPSSATDAWSMPARKAAASGATGASSGADTNAGVASTTASPTTSRTTRAWWPRSRAGRGRRLHTGTGGGRGRGDPPTGALPGQAGRRHPAADGVAQRVGQRARQPAHAAPGGEEHGPAGVDPLRPQRGGGPHQAGLVRVEVAGRRQLGRGDLQRQPVAVAGVDAAHQGRDQPVEHLVAEPPADQRPDALVGAAGRAVVGQHQVVAGPLDAGGRQQAGGGEGVEVGGHAQQLVGRAGGAARRRATRRPTPPQGETRSVSMPSSAHRSTASGTRARKASADSSRSTPPSGDVCSLPPGRSPASSTSTVAPCRRASQAAASPLMPPPMTARSTCCPIR